MSSRLPVIKTLARILCGMLVVYLVAGMAVADADGEGEARWFHLLEEGEQFWEIQKKTVESISSKGAQMQDRIRALEARAAEAEKQLKTAHGTIADTTGKLSEESETVAALRSELKDKEAALKGGLEPLPEEAVKKLLASRARLGVSTPNTLENRCGL